MDNQKWNHVTVCKTGLVKNSFTTKPFVYFEAAVQYVSYYAMATPVFAYKSYITEFGIE